LLPLSQGEFDEPIGLPLVVVCQNVDKMDLLEREMGYKEELFDFIQQFLRTILLKRKPHPHESCLICRRRIITLLITITFIVTVPVISTQRLTTSHPPILRSIKTQCRRPRSRLCSQRLGLMGKNPCSKRWF